MKQYGIIRYHFIFETSKWYNVIPKMRLVNEKAINLKISNEMFDSLQTIAKKEYNTVQGVCRRFISEGIAIAKENQVA